MAKYFSESEFRRCTPACSEADMDAAFVRVLDRVRERAGIPLVLTSAYRSPEWEVAHGRSGKGDHPQGRGVDVRCGTGASRYKIVAAALAEGINRIGIGKNYVHLGAGAQGLPQDVIWHYYGE